MFLSDTSFVSLPDYLENSNRRRAIKPYWRQPVCALCAYPGRYVEGCVIESSEPVSPALGSIACIQ